MRPEPQELDEEIRGHLAISVKERIDRGEDPEAARLAALRELGYIPAIRDSMHRVWYSRGFDAVAALVREMRMGMRSLLRARGLAVTVVVTLALGIGANAAIVVTRDLKSSISGTENVVFAAPRPGALCRM